MSDDIDDILWATEKPQPLISQYRQNKARERLKQLDQVGAEYVYIVKNQDSPTKFLLLLAGLRPNYVKHSNIQHRDKTSSQYALLTEQQYEWFKDLGFPHTAEFYPKLTNRQLLDWGLY